MRYIIYNKQNGLAIREIEASILADAVFGLPSTQDAVASPVDSVEDVWVDEEGELRIKADLSCSVTSTDITLGNSVFWSEILENTAVFVDKVYIGKVESDGLFELEPEEIGTYLVELIKPIKYRKKEYIVNVT